VSPASGFDRCVEDIRLRDMSIACIRKVGVNRRRQFAVNPANGSDG